MGLLLLAGAPLRAGDEEEGTYAGRDARWWVQELGDREGARAARVALVKIGRPALEPVAEALASEERSVRLLAAAVLSELRVDVAPVLPQVVGHLDTADAQFQSALLGVVRKAGPAAAPHRQAILPLLASPREGVARSAAGVLGALGAAARDALPAILDRLRTAPPGMRQPLLGAAIAIAPDAPDVVPALSDAWRRSDDRERDALLGLARRMQPNLEGLGDLAEEASRDPAAPVRVGAARLLGHIVLEAPSQRQTLIALLEDSDPFVRAGAADGLTPLGARAAPAIPALERLLDDSDPTAHVAAVRALAAIGPGAAGALPRVLGVLRRGEPSGETTQAVRAFVASSPEATRRALEVEDERVTEMAFAIVASWPPDRLAGVLSEILHPVTKALRDRQQRSGYAVHVVVALGRLAEDREEALVALISLHAASQQDVRDAAMRILAHPRHADLLVELLASESPSEQTFAVSALAQALPYHMEAFRGRLMPLLHHGVDGVRVHATRLLVQHLPTMEPRTLDPRDGEALAAGAASMLADPATGGPALRRLTWLGPFALPYVERIAEILHEETRPSRGNHAALALRMIASHGEEARARVEPLLVGRLHGDDPVAAAHAAGGLAPDRAYEGLLVQALPALIRHEKPTVHFPAVEAARQMGTRATPLIPVLLELLGRHPPESQVGASAAAALGTIAPSEERVVRALLAALDDPARREHAISIGHALRGGDETTARLVADALEGARLETKVHLLNVLASYALRASSLRDRVRPLIEHPDARVAEAATRALEALGG